MASRPTKKPRFVYDFAAFQNIRVLRASVHAPGQPPSAASSDEDGMPSARHVAGYVDNGSGRKLNNLPVSCVSFFYRQDDGVRSYQVRFISTHAHYRKMGAAEGMLKFALAKLAKETNIRIFWTNAREDAVGFYQECGWKKEGEPIPHHDPKIKSTQKMIITV